MRWMQFRWNRRELVWLLIGLNGTSKIRYDMCTLICVTAPASQHVTRLISSLSAWGLISSSSICFFSVFYYSYEWQSKIVQHINRSNWIKADPQYIIWNTHTHTHTLARSHIVTLLNLRLRRYVFGGTLAKRICLNSGWYCYLSALDCSSSSSNNIQNRKRKIKKEIRKTW